MGKPNNVAPQAPTMMSCGPVTLVPVCTPGGVRAGLRGPWASKTALSLGIVQIILGTLLMVAQSVLFAKHSVGGIHGLGFVCGVLFIVTGAFGIVAGKNKTKCAVVTLMVLSILSASFTAVIFCAGAVGIAVDHEEYHNYQELDYHWYEGGCWCDDYVDYGVDYNTYHSSPSSISYPWMSSSTIRTDEAYPDCQMICADSPYYYYSNHGLRRLIFSMHGLMMAFALVELILAIVASALTCRAVCCCSPAQPAQQYAYVLPMPSGQTGAPQVAAGMMASPAVLQLNPNNINGQCAQVVLPVDVPRYEEAQATSNRPPSYTSLTDNINEASSAPVV